MELTELLDIGRQERSQQKAVQIRCCTAAGCLSANSQAVQQQLEQAVKAEGLEGEVQVSGVGCMRLCCQGPLVEVEGSGEEKTKQRLYEKVTPEDASAIIGALKGKEAQLSVVNLEQPFFTYQAPIVLENSGKIDPERIQAYIAAQGYQGLYQVLREMTPAAVVDSVSRSGLRGRGGAGYPTGLKWATVAKAKGERKFVICNADEGDPGECVGK